ncbi:cytochrome c1 [Undibacter mobilis]|uniref:Cytochrome c1 n=1 Tax=Undibacter mobilis TaxID=2292256 RepID=A0A371B485_9BRAD|nr:cytochrome c1 [Undibacter mobilis]
MTMHRTFIALALAVSLGSSAAQAAEDAHAQPKPPAQKWSFSGPFGKFDEGQLQRGFKVFKEVCASCHSMSLVSFRNLAEPGGPGFSEKQIEALAAEYKIKDLDDKGEAIERNGRPADKFPAPFANALAAAAANGGVAPPDFSTLAKARTYERGFPWWVIDIFSQFQEQGPDYIHAILVGYEDAPKDFVMPAGGNYNKYFPGHVIAMPKPLTEGQVTYDDGAPQTLEQYSHDVAAFMMWAAEPHLVARKRLGFQVMIFLLVLSGLLYFTKKKVWSAVH